MLLNSMLDWKPKASYYMKVQKRSYRKSNERAAAQSWLLLPCHAISKRSRLICLAERCLIARFCSICHRTREEHSPHRPAHPPVLPCPLTPVPVPPPAQRRLTPTLCFFRTVCFTSSEPWRAPLGWHSRSILEKLLHRIFRCEFDGGGSRGLRRQWRVAMACVPRCNCKLRGTPARELAAAGGIGPHLSPFCLLTLPSCLLLSRVSLSQGHFYGLNNALMRLLRETGNIGEKVRNALSSPHHSRTSMLQRHSSHHPPSAAVAARLPATAIPLFFLITPLLPCFSHSPALTFRCAIICCDLFEQAWDDAFHNIGVPEAINPAEDQYVGYFAGKVGAVPVNCGQFVDGPPKVRTDTDGQRHGEPALGLYA